MMPITYPFGYFSLPGAWVKNADEKRAKKVVVISSFGNSSIETMGLKSVPIEQMLGRNIFNRSMAGLKNDDSLTKIEGFFDEKKKIVYLHLKGIFDTSMYIEACKSFKEEIKSKGFLEVWADWKFQYARALLLLFSVSHIMLFHHPNHIFDISYISLFKALDAIRAGPTNLMGEVLKDIPNLSREWLENGRPCSPRVLFIFSSSRIPHHIMREALEEKQTGSKVDKARNHPLRKLELNLEYQIYRLLRNSRVITNVSINSLFALPNNQPFVYICEEHQEPSFLSKLVKENLTSLCNAKEPVVRNFKSMLLEEKTMAVAEDPFPNHDTNLVLNRRHRETITPLSEPSEADDLSDFLLSSISVDRKLNLEHSFSTFLQLHIDEALNKGFDDNVGRNAGTGYFEIPSLNTWFAVYKRLYEFYVEESDKENKFTGALRHILNTDIRFSEARCSKAMPLAIATYKNGLPSYYSRDEHESKLAMALSVLSGNARGPKYATYVADLKKTCEDHWMDGRIGCQTMSIMGNACTQPRHRQSEDESDETFLPVLNHDSEILYAGYCNCGYSKVQIQDPFTDKEAFIDLYTHLKKDCCMKLLEISFCSLSYEMEVCSLKQNDLYESSDDIEPEQNMESDDSSDCRESSLTILGSSLESQGIPKDMLRSNDNSSDEEEKSPTPSLSEIIPIESDSTEGVKPLKPSGHDVASAMLTMNSPENFMPKYATWSLLCLGPSSLYSHNIGISDQPGFLSGTNFLLPWDVAVSIPDRKSWPAIVESMGKKIYFLKNKINKSGIRDSLIQHKKGKPKGEITEFNVKVFLGCEYQCLRGHRFMMADIDKYLKASNVGHVKDTASKIANSDMPLYYPCPCSRNGTIMNAQLMRLHVVTPKAPVNITLNPIIQPSPAQDARFIPQPLSDGQILLSASTYWVLRLPFFYVDETQFYEPPDLDQTVDANFGKLLKGCYGITEINIDER